MKEESGRSLIEVIGVMAIAGVMTISALGIYNMLRTNQVRTIATADLAQIAENTKLLNPEGTRLLTSGGAGLMTLWGAGPLASWWAGLMTSWWAGPMSSGLSTRTACSPSMRA